MGRDAQVSMATGLFTQRPSCKASCPPHRPTDGPQLLTFLLFLLKTTGCRLTKAASLDDFLRPCLGGLRSGAKHL